MRDLLALCTPDDLAFLVGLLESPLNATDDTRLRALLAKAEAEAAPEARENLEDAIADALGYLGSGEAQFWWRKAWGQTPGVPFQQVARDVARSLGLEVRLVGTDREVAETIAELYATRTFAGLAPEEQQRMLESLGVERDKAAAFVKRSAGVFALPVLVQAFDVLVVRGLIQGVVLGAITKVIGAAAAQRILGFAVGRLPWWVGWVGPAAWTLSITSTALKLQGPAERKTIPAVLYLGLVALRHTYAADG